jgi:hypothetical protein
MKRAGIIFLIVALVAIALRVALDQMGGGETPDTYWRDYAHFGVNTVLVLAIIWFGFEVSIGLEAKQGDSAAWSRPALAICGFAAVYVAQQAVKHVQIRLNDATSMGLNNLFWWLFAIMTFTLVAVCLPLMWYLFQKSRGALDDLRHHGPPAADADHVAAGDQWAAVNDLALQQLHKTIMGDEEPIQAPAPRGRRR